MLEQLLNELQREPHFDHAVAAARVLEARPAEHAEFQLRADLREGLRRLGVERLFSHQAEALRLARDGKNVVVATPTASGKTLCFNLPVLETILAEQEKGRDAHALYLFPLKALEQDQLKNLLRLRDAIGLHESFTAAILDGDTKESERRRLRKQPPHLLLSNPDMLHASILPGHDRWAGFFSSLRFIVLDELHTYRGVFGSHVLHILRRLRRIAEYYGAHPQVIATSATINNPRELAQQLFALPFELVAGSGAPTGPRHVMLLDPDDSALAFATSLFSRAVLAGVKTIAFCKSRRATELLYTWTIDRHPQLRRHVSAYRAGYLAEERREIEAALFGGQLRGVVSTSALEMGIDVGGLDAAILVGYPGSIMSTWQRAGRAGRGTEPAALFLVAGHDALDQYYIGAPHAFFTAAAESAVVDATNATIRSSHLLCAGAEMPLLGEEPVYGDIDWREAREDLQAKGLLLQSVGGESWVPLMSRPHREVDIRQIGDTFTIHPADEQRRVLGTIGGSRVFAECHEGAVYLHRGQHLQVDVLDVERKRVVVSPADGSYFTVARSAKQTEILEIYDSRAFGGTTVHFGRLRITQRITGYERRASLDQRLLGTLELDLPPTIYETQGLWIEIEAGIVRTLEAHEHHRMGSLHGIEHAFIALSPLFTLCDAADLGGITFTEHPQVRRGAIFIYDTYPGGIGLAARMYEILPQVLNAVRARVDTCSCSDGCPGCVHSPRCGSGNYPLDKWGSRLALDVLLGLQAATAVIAPSTPETSETDGPAVPSADAAVVSEGEQVTALAAAEIPAGGLTAPAASTSAARVLYFDVETQRSALEVGGWGHIDRMGLALAVVYDEKDATFETYHEADVSRLLEKLKSADLVVGYNVIRFDYKVLSYYTKEDLRRLPTFDMLVELRRKLGFRLSLGALATATLGSEKSADGLQSLEWVRDGRLDLVEDYCRQDVALTRDLFQHALQHGSLVFIRDTVRLKTPPLGWELQGILREAAKSSAARVRDRQVSLFQPEPPRPNW